MHTQLHGKGLFLPDDLRHLLKQPSHPLIRFRQLCAFLLQMLLPPHKLRDIRGGDLRISKPRRCFDALLRKAQLRAVGKPENIKLRIQTADGWRRGAQGVMQLRKRLNAAFAQLACYGKHSVVNKPHHAVFIKKADRNGQTVKALFDPVHMLLFTSRFLHPEHDILQAVLILFPFERGEWIFQMAEGSLAGNT